MITIVVILFCIVAVAIRKMEGSWYSPAALFSLLWSLIIVFSVVSAPDYYFSVPALLFILFNLILFFTGGKLYEYFYGLKSTDSLPPVRNVDYSKIKYLYVVPGIISGWLALIFLIYDSGGDLYLLFDKSKLMYLSSKLTVERYEGVRLSGLTMLCLTISYFSSFYAGMDLAIRPGWQSRIRLVFLLAPITIFTLVYTARAVLLYMLIIVVASFISFKPFGKNKQPALFNKLNLIVLVTSLGLLMIVFFFSQAARMEVDNFSSAQVQMLLNHLKVWFSGNVSAFSIWFESIKGIGTENPGSNTFAGFMELLGVSWRIPGIYVLSMDVNRQMEFSNIYTLFRFLIDDFNQIGTCIILFVTGIFSKMLYMRGGSYQSFVSGAFLSGIVLMIVWSFIASALAYNSILFAWIGFVIVVKFNLRHAN